MMDDAIEGFLGSRMGSSAAMRDVTKTQIFIEGYLTALSDLQTNPSLTSVLLASLHPGFEQSISSFPPGMRSSREDNIEITQCEEGLKELSVLESSKKLERTFPNRSPLRQPDRPNTDQRLAQKPQCEVSLNKSSVMESSKKLESSYPRSPPTRQPHRHNMYQRPVPKPQSKEGLNESSGEDSSKHLERSFPKRSPMGKTRRPNTYQRPAPKSESEEGLNESSVEDSSKHLEMSFPQRSPKRQPLRPNTYQTPLPKPAACPNTSTTKCDTHITANYNGNDQINTLQHRIKVGSVKKVEVVYGMKNDYWVNLVDDLPALSKLSVELNERINHSSPGFTNPPRPGDWCCKKYDGNWTRARISSVPRSIIYVDYGNCEEFTLDQLKVLPKDLTSDLPYAMHVYDPQGLSSTELSSLTLRFVSVDSAGLWTVERTDSSQRPVSPQNPVTPTQSRNDIELSKKSKYRIEVGSVKKVEVVYGMKNDYWVNLVDDLPGLSKLSFELNKRISDSSPGFTKPPQPGDWCCKKYDGNWTRARISSEPRSIIYVDYGNCEEFTLDQLKVLPEDLACDLPYAIHVYDPQGLSSTDLSSLTLHFVSVDPAGVWTVERASSSQKPVSLQNPVTPTQSRNDIERTKTPKYRIEVGSEKKVEVVYGMKNDYWINLVDDLPALSQLSLELNKRMSDSSPGFTKPPQPGDWCCKKYDGNWTRARISSEPRSIIYVDYGNCEEFTLDQLKVLPEDLACDLPYAIHVYDPQGLSSTDLSSLTLHFVSVDPAGVWTVERASSSQKPVSLQNPATPTQSRNDIERSKTPKYRIEVGSEKKVEVVYGMKNDYWINLVDDLPALSQFSLELNKRMSDSSPGFTNPPQPGDWCCKKYDGNWTRARISSEPRSIIYVDYGNCEEFTLDQLKVLPEDLACDLPYAIHVYDPQGLSSTDLSSLTLHFVSVDPAGVWTVERTASSQKLVSLQNTVTPTQSRDDIECSKTSKHRIEVGSVKKVEVVYGMKNDYWVNLVDDLPALSKLSLELNKRINDSSPGFTNLPQPGDWCCKKYDGNWTRARISSEPRSLIYVDYGNCEEFTLDQLKVLPKDLTSDLPYAMHVYDPQGLSSTDLSSLTLRFVSVDSAGVWTVERAVSSQKPVTPTQSRNDIEHSKTSRYRIEVGSVKKVEVVYGMKNDYWVNLVDDLPALSQLSLELNKRMNDSSPGFTNPPQPGDWCCKKYDGNWTRARISSEPRSLIYVDYGNSEEFTLDQLKVLPEDLACDLPYAIHVHDPQGLSSTDLSSLTLRFVSVDSAGLWTVERAVSSQKPVTPTQFRNDIEHSKTSRYRIEVGSEKKVEVVYGMKNDYWINLVDDLPALSQLSLELNKRMNDSSPGFTNPPQPGVWCCKKYDGNWTRARISSVPRSLIYVDYGNSEEFTLDQLKVLPEDLACDLPYAIHVHDPQGLSSTDLSSLTLRFVSVDSAGLWTVERTFSSQKPVSPQKLVSPTQSRKVIENVLSKTLKHRIEVGSEKEVEVVYGMKNDYWVNLIDDLPALSKLSLELNKRMNDSSPGFTNPPQPGVWCCKKYDGNWTRARISSVPRSLIYVDYGNSEEFTLDQLKVLPNDLTNDLPYAINVYDPQGLSSADLSSLTLRFVSVDAAGRWTVERASSKVDTSDVSKLKGSCSSLDTNGGNQSDESRISSIEQQNNIASTQIRKSVTPFFKNGEIVSVRIQHAENASDLYATKVDSLQELDKMQEDLNAVISDRSHPLKNVAVNAKVAAKYEGMWYRGKLVSVNPLKVRYIDYGNVETCDLGDIKELPDVFAKKGLLTTLVHCSTPLSKTQLLSATSSLTLRVNMKEGSRWLVDVVSSEV